MGEKEKENGEKERQTDRQRHRERGKTEREMNQKRERERGRQTHKLLISEEGQELG